MTRYTWLVPALPAFAALAGLLLGRRRPGLPAVIAIAGTGFATALSVVLAAQVLPDAARTRTSASVLTPTGGVRIVVGTRADGLAALVTVMVCVVALLVQIYSTAYLRGDARYSSYAALVSLFTAAMLLVVLSADLLELLVGWEVMGVCSYFLIGHIPGKCPAALSGVR